MRWPTFTAKALSCAECKVCTYNSSTPCNEGCLCWIVMNAEEH